MSVFECIRNTLCTQLDLNADDITMDTNIMEDFDLDSLDMVEVAMDLEETFNMEVSDEALTNLHTVGDFVALVEENADPSKL